MYAIVLTGGKQYKVSAGDTLDVEKLEANAGDKVELQVIMTVDGETICVGSDIKAKVTASVVSQNKAKKVVVFKYKAKKNVRKKKGHRQFFTKIKIDSIA